MANPPISFEDLPRGSVAVIDEAYLQFHSRESMAEQGRAISGLVNLSRQRDQTLIFVTQEARQIDRNIASSANVVVFKQPGMLQFGVSGGATPELNPSVAVKLLATNTLTAAAKFGSSQ